MGDRGVTVKLLFGDYECFLYKVTFFLDVASLLCFFSSFSVVFPSLPFTFVLIFFFFYFSIFLTIFPPNCSSIVFAVLHFIFMSIHCRRCFLPGCDDAAVFLVGGILNLFLVFCLKSLFVIIFYFFLKILLKNGVYYN